MCMLCDSMRKLLEVLFPTEKARFSSEPNQTFEADRLQQSQS